MYGVLVPGHDGRAGCAALLLDPAIPAFDWTGYVDHITKNLPRYAVPLFLRLTKEIKLTGNNSASFIVNFRTTEA